jgi:small-conductance mechanosensitive channel
MPAHVLQIFRGHGHEWAIGVVIVSVALLVSLFAHDICFRILARFRPKAQRGPSTFLLLAQRLRRPAQVIVILTGIGIVVPLLPVPHHILDPARKVLWVLWFVNLGWLMIAAVYGFEDALVQRYDINASDNVRARRIRTQLHLMRRMVITLLVIVDAGLVLSLFQDSKIWHYGAGLLASAGLASLVLATAAKTSVSNLLAGLQIAIAEPIRLDDVVIVEGEWGRIEEISTTYVVVAIWDKRRLVVPLSYFIENPFQNWTRTTSDLLGTAFLYVDYSIPVDALRTELRRILENEPLWDRQVCALQVTDLSERTMQIRCLLSARNSSHQFDLRCIVREKMISFIKQNYPEAFPLTRFSALSHEPDTLGNFPVHNQSGDVSRRQ